MIARPLRTPAAALVLMLLSAIPAAAQLTTGTLIGTIKDAQEA